MSGPPPTVASGGPARPDLTRLVGLKLGNYRLERLLGHGRMGVVYLAQDVALLRPTAIKVLSWSAADAQGQDPLRWFLAEARLVARINHPRVVQVYGAARHGDFTIIAMEYVAGQSAEALVAGGVPMPPDQATDVLVQVASALDAAHRSGVVHRDVKPANLLVGQDGVVKLGDFGMALGEEIGAGTARLRVGTPYYTAPEVWRGDPATPASDLYSLGATYHQLLTGVPPFPGADQAAVERAHLAEPPPDPRRLVPGLPASCAALVARSLAKAPRDRHPSAQLLLWEGRRVLQELAASAAHSAARPRRPHHPGGRGAVRPPLPPAEGPLAELLGFVHRPFAEVDPAALPFPASPLAAARDALLARLDDDAVAVALLSGEEGSGAASLCRRLAPELGLGRLALTVEPPRSGDPRGLIARLGRAAGVAEAATEEATLDALVERFAEEHHRQGGRPVVVVEGLPPGAPPPGLAALVGAARWSRSFQAIVVGGPGLDGGLAAAGLDLPTAEVARIAVEPLPRAQLGPYVRAWLEAALPAGAPPLLLSPDALLLLGLRSDGGIDRIDCLGENMLLLAAAGRRRILTSWHAWAAADRERWAGRRPLAALPRRPENWPPPEVIDVIDVARRGGDVPPWPRGATGG